MGVSPPARTPPRAPNQWRPPVPTTPPVRRRLRALVAPPLLLAALGWSAPAPAEGLAGPYLAAEQAARRGDVAAAATYFGAALAQDPANPDLMERAVTHQVAAGQIDSAVALARQLEAARPGHHLSVLLLAADALRRGDWAAARAQLASEAGEQAPFVGQLVDAWAAFGAGDAAAARALLTALETDEIGGPAGQLVAAYHLGLVEAAAGDDLAAVAAFERAQERSGTGTLRLARLRAGALARLGRVAEAQALVTERLAETFGDRRLERLAADLAQGTVPDPVVRTAEEGAAESLFSIAGFLARGANRVIGLGYARLGIWLNPDLVEARLLAADMLNEDAQYAQAISVFEGVPSDAPEALDAMIGRAEAIEADGRPEDGIAAMNEVVARFPRTLEAQTALGDMLRRQEKFAEAATAYDAAVALVPVIENRHWPLLYQRGIAFERSKQWPRAEADFRRALALEPDQPLVLNYLGYSLVDMGLNLTEARAMIEKAVEQRPDDGYIVDSLGWVLYRLGDFAGAVTHLERAVELRPVDPVINDHFGDALWLVGRKTEARFQWRRALSFEPEAEAATRIRRKLADGLDVVLAEEEAAGKPAILGGGDPVPGAPAKNGG